MRLEGLVALLHASAQLLATHLACVSSAAVTCPPGWLITGDQLCLGVPETSSRGVSAASASGACSNAALRHSDLADPADPSIASLLARLTRGRSLWVNGCRQVAGAKTNQLRTCCLLTPSQGISAITNCSELHPPLCTSQPLLRRQRRALSLFSYTPVPSTTMDHAGAIAGGATGALALCVSLGVILYCLCPCKSDQDAKDSIRIKCAAKNVCNGSYVAHCCKISPVVVRN